MFPGFEVSHLSSFSMSSGHSGPVLTLRTNDAADVPLPNPHLLQEDISVWATSLLAVVVRCIFCGFFFPPVMLPSEIPKLPTDMAVRAFPAVQKLLLHDSLPRKGLHP